MNGQVTFSQINNGGNRALEFENVIVSCLAFTIFDAEDEASNSGPTIGSRVQISRPGLQFTQQRVDWSLLPPTPQ